MLHFIVATIAGPFRFLIRAKIPHVVLPSAVRTATRIFLIYQALFQPAAKPTSRQYLYLSRFGLLRSPTDPCRPLWPYIAPNYPRRAPQRFDQSIRIQHTAIIQPTCIVQTLSLQYLRPNKCFFIIKTTFASTSGLSLRLVLALILFYISLAKPFSRTDRLLQFFKHKKL
jgi:hypothetical protein